MPEWFAKLVWRVRAIVSPPVTLGARIAVFDTQGRTVLVRHTYAPGWFFPGGAVDPGETASEAATREFREETGLELIGTPVLYGLYFNRAFGGRDHVALFVVRDHPPFEPADIEPQAAEIAEAVVADAAAPPDGITGATARRLGEIIDGRTPAALW